MNLERFVSCHYGSTRMAILMGNYAVKIPRMTEWRCFLSGLLGNMQEVKFSETDWPELCPLVFSLPGGFLLVMRRAQPLTLEEWNRFKKDLPAFCDKKYYAIPVEKKRDSFGWLDGQIVAIDYGS